MLILKIFLLLAAVASFGALLTEVVIKTACGKQHGGKANFYIFLGVTVEHMNDDPWFVWLATCSILPYAVALVVYKWLKARCPLKSYTCPGNLAMAAFSAPTPPPGWKALPTG